PPGGGTAFSEKQWTVDEIAQMDEEVGAPEAAAARAVDPSEDSDVPATQPPAEPAPPAQPPAATPRRPVSGRYRSSGRPFELELRVDVDGVRPTLRVSGDFFRKSGATTSYSSSFIVNLPTVRASPSLVRIRGSAQFSYSYPNPYPVVEVTIPRVAPHQQPAAATVGFYDAAGRRGASYACDFVSPFFRSVQYEQDVVKGTLAFDSYDTGQLPSGGASRTLSVVSAYAEAGIEVQVAGMSNVLDPGGSGADRKWSNAELHASMVRQFSLWRDSPQWKVWLLVATDHERGDLRGIMFDQAGKQRQGCAVFYDRISGDDAAARRAALRTYVHELGHCFNLLHSWQKSLAVPPQPNRLDALSWMNYVQNYPGGAAAYWAAFPFQFDDPELVHLRHAFRDNVIMGGANFGTGAADFDAESFFEPLEDNSGLKLELRARKSFVQSEPVVVEIKLSTTDLRGRRVHTRLHPDFGFVQLAVQMPSGQTIPYQPLVEQCTETETTVLDEENPSIYASAYIGYGRKGFYFDQSGLYNLRAIYHALDGSQVVSNVLTLRVRSPLDRDEEEIAELYSGNDQGTLFHLLGSDSEELDSGNKAFENVIDKHGEHPLAVYAHLVRGINAGRSFKTITEEKNLDQRPPQHEEAVEALKTVVDKSKKGKGVDNITLNMAMRRLARAQEGGGDERAAARTLDDLVSFFRDSLKLRPHVVRQIEERTSGLRSEVLKDGGAAATGRKARKSTAKKGGGSSRKGR
ncbi:MAG TPA: hypothetical protein VG148_06555, partial [Pyrinomonadaceae bacterium]|nr:hypothetical protein [Pyrinomonadaceae bacterium]